MSPRWSPRSATASGRHRAPTARSPTAAAAAYDGARRGWDDVAPSKALDATWSLIRATNAYLETNEPWKSEPGPEVDAVMGDALEALRIVSDPGLPGRARDGADRLGADRLHERHRRQRLPEAAAWGGYPGGLTVTKGDPLFPRIT